MAPAPARRAEALLLLLGVALALGGAEAAVRIAGLDRTRPTGYAPVDTDRRGPRPRNWRGYRDEEHDLAKPPGVRRLVALGDSFAWGASVDFEDAWPRRLQRGLSRRRKQTWESVSLALPGLACVDYAAQLRAEALSYSPDLIVVGYVLNDAETKDQMKERERRYAEREARPPGLLEGSALVRFAAGRVRATADARERIAYHRGLYQETSPSWRGTRGALREMGAACRERGVPWVVAIFPLFGNPLDGGYPFADVHAQVARAAEEAGARVVDLLPAYRGLRWELLVVNGSLDEHPNEIAHRIAAGVLLRALDDVVSVR